MSYRSNDYTVYANDVGSSLATEIVSVAVELDKHHDCWKHATLIHELQISWGHVSSQISSISPLLGPSILRNISSDVPALCLYVSFGLHQHSPN